MDISEQEAFTIVERLLVEFFDPYTGNARKHEIERLLSEFKDAPLFREYCLYFLCNSSSQYMTMFALSCLEIVITQQWMAADWTYREAVKNVIHNYLIEKGVSGPHCFRNKYAKLLVDIAREDWPDRYQNFMPDIFELLKNEHSYLVGLVLLRTASEEFMGPTPALLTSRKAEITRLMQYYIPLSFELLSNILENLGAKPRLSETATPPPSPTHPGTNHDYSHQLSAVSFRPGNNAVSKEILATLQHLFTWAPVGHIAMSLITGIFSYTNVSSYAQDDDDLGILAMSTINELLYRKYLDSGLVAQLYHHTVQLLRDITSPTSGRIETLGPDFMEKLSELTTLLIGNHLWRLESDPNFSALEFLSLLYQLTMQLPSAESFLRYLASWTAYIKQIKPQSAQKYTEVFKGLVSGILKKIQFIHNHSQLEKLNNTLLADESETELQAFFKNSIELIALIAEFAPNDTFNQTLLLWKTGHDIHFSVQNSKDVINAAMKNGEETLHLSYLLRDFATLTQALTRLSSLFLDQDKEEVNKATVPLANSLIHSLLESAILATNNKIYESRCIRNCLISAFICVHAELLAAIKTWLFWLSQNSEISTDYLKQLLQISLSVLTPGPGTVVPCTISHAASSLLLSLTDAVFPPHLTSFPPVVEFIHLAPSLTFDCFEETSVYRNTRLVVAGAVCNMLFRGWGDLEREERRQFLIGAYFSGLTRDFKELTAESDERKVQDVVERTLPVLTHIVEFSKKFSNGSKWLVYNVLRPTIQHALTLFPSYVKYPDVGNHILSFFLSVLSVLQQHLGSEGTKDAVQVFLQVAVSQQQASNFSGLDKLLQILKFVIESPGSSHKLFLPGILELCLENIYPAIISQANEIPDVFVALLSLLSSVLQHRWQYFYLSQVRRGYSPACSDSEVSCDGVQHPETLLSILQVFGQALLQDDINVFRVSIKGLQEVDNKWKLFHKGLFRENLLGPMLNVLLHTLIERSQVLVTDDINTLVHSMASVNIKAYYTTFLQQFVVTVEDITPEQRELLLSNSSQIYDEDIPSFTRHLERFVSDVRYYRLSNANKNRAHLLGN